MKPLGAFRGFALKIQRTVHTLPRTPRFQNTEAWGKTTEKAAFLVFGGWGRGGDGGAPVPRRNRTRAQQDVEGWGPRRSREGSCAPPSGTPDSQSGDAEALLHAGPSRPGFDSKTPPRVQLEQVVSSTRATFPPRQVWNLGRAETGQPPTPGPGFHSFPQQLWPKQPVGTEMPPSPGTEPLRDCAPPFGEPRGPRCFRTAWQGPFIPQAAPGSPALPPLPGACVQGRARLPRPGWKAAQTNPQSSRPWRPCPNTRTLGSGREPRHARARVGVLEASALP